MILERDVKFWNRALNLCQFSDHRVRVGCVAANNGKVFGGAFNTIRNPQQNVEFRNATYHAEFNCLRMFADRPLARVTFYIARIDRAGEAMPSRPCYVCYNHLKNAGAGEIVYWNGTELVKERL